MLFSNVNMKMKTHKLIFLRILTSDHVNSIYIKKKYQNEWP